MNVKNIKMVSCIVYINQADNLGILSHIEAIQALLMHISSYSDIFRTLCKLCLDTTMPYLEPEAFSKVC